MRLWLTGEERREREAARSPARRRAGILFWAVLISFTLGAIRFGEPLEAIPRAIRDTIRAHPASGKIVVVAKDDASVTTNTNQPFPRRDDAKVIDRLFAMGTKRVFFDQAFGFPTNTADDDAMTAALARHPGRVFLGVRPHVNRLTKELSAALLPIPSIRARARIVSLYGLDSPMGFAPRFPSVMLADGETYYSFARVLADKPTKRHRFDTPDLSLRLSSIPTVSFVDVLHGRVKRNFFAGRDVVISPVADMFGDNHYVFPQGVVPGSYVLIAMAETLLASEPREWGWTPLFIVASFLSILAIYGRSVMPRAAVAVGVLIFVFVPMALDFVNVRLELFPGAFLLTIVGLRSRNLKRSLAQEGLNKASGLPNFSTLRDTLRGEVPSLVALKIRNFAEIIASVGREAEGQIIAEVTARLRLTQQDRTIYHGNDCLVWCLSETSVTELSDHIDGLAALLNAPVRLGDRSIDVSVVFGIDTEVERPVESRLGSALALAEEAAASGTRWKRSDPSRHADTDWRLSLLGQLDRALANGEMWVAYQPQLDLRSGQLVAAEALVRWSHPERGNVRPDEFVPAAENGSRIDKLTFFVLERAIADAAAFNVFGKPFSVAVNLSTKLLDDAALGEKIGRIIAHHRLPPDRLTIEITESSQIERPRQAAEVMADLRRRGFNVSIDDYGTGFSTLDYLRSVPANEIKLDKRFVVGMLEQDADRILVDSTIALAHSLGKRVVAEGVETIEVLDLLRALNCDLAQGYLVDHPLAFDALLGRLHGQIASRRVS